MRNSVKATVDAYDGTVSSTQWDEKDPILKAWEGAFPGTVKPKSDDPAGPARAPALPRGPVQGAALPARALPRHRPADVLRRQRPVGGAGGPGEQGQASSRRTGCRCATPGGGHDPVFSLTSVYVPEQPAEPRVVHLGRRRRGQRRTTARSGSCGCPATRRCRARRRSPTCSARTATSRTSCWRSRRTNAKALYGNLLTLPVGDGLLYVQPLYTQRKSGARHLSRAAATCWCRSASRSASARR